MSFSPEPLLKEIKLQASSTPATITNKSHRELLQSGYFAIGELEINHETERSYDSDPTTHAQLEAARLGGELILISAHNKQKIIEGYRHGECLSFERKTIHVQEIGGGFVYKTVHECRLYQKLKIETPVNYSAGIVYAKVPSITKTDYPRFLEKAIQLDKYEDVKFYLSKGFNPSTKFDDNISLLTFALKKNSIDTAKVIIDANADLYAMDGDEPYTFPVYRDAITDSHNEIGILAVGKLKDLNHNPKRGYAPLVYAVEQDKIELVKMLLQKGANVNHVNNGNVMAFQKVKSLEMAKLLLKNGAKNIHSVGWFGVTALTTAIKERNVELVKFLIEKGADVNGTKFKSDSSDPGRSPLEMAKKDFEVYSKAEKSEYTTSDEEKKRYIKEAKHCEEIIDILKKHGAK